MIFKRLKKSISLTIGSLLSVGYLSAQDQQHFSLYYMQPSIINPAAMCIYDHVNGALTGTYQLSGFTNNPAYFQLDVGIPVGKTGLYLGPSALYDRIGAFNRVRVGLNIAYRIKLSMKHYLSFGINGAAVVANGDLFNMVGNQPGVDPGDPSFLSGVNGVWNPDIKIGAHYFTDNFYVGFNVGNIFVNKFWDTGSGATNEIRVNATDMHYYLMTGWQKKIGPSWRIKPNALIKYIPNSPLQFDINMNAVFKNTFGFGLSYRSINTLVVNANFTIAKVFVIGYAFNWGLGYESRSNYTGHEVLLAFRIQNPKRIIPVDVPRF